VQFKIKELHMLIRPPNDKEYPVDPEGVALMISLAFNSKSKLSILI
jgi:hypothetical protein